MERLDKSYNYDIAVETKRSHYQPREIAFVISSSEKVIQCKIKKESKIRYFYSTLPLKIPKCLTHYHRRV